MWEKLKEQIINPLDQVLFEEAAKAAGAGALRAAYIIVWINCAESLKRKFKEASSFDKDAAISYKEICELEQQSKASDKLILDKAKSYGFISHAEHQQLETVRSMRNVFAHPNEVEPFPEQLESAALVAKFVLSCPTKLRQGYLSRQSDYICSHPTFLDDHYPAVERCAQTLYSRTSEDCHLWFVEKLWKDFSPKIPNVVNDPTLSKFYRRVVWFTQAFLKCVESSFFDKWNDSQMLLDYPDITYALAESDLFQKLTPQAKDMVVNALCEQVRYQANIALPLQNLDRDDVLSERQSELLKNALSTTSLSSLCSAGISPNYFYDRLVEKFKSKHWPTQEEGVKAVRVLCPNGLQKLSESQQRTLGNNVLQAADGFSWAASSLLVDISNTKVTCTTPFIEGLISECVINDDDQFRLKVHCAEQAMKSIVVLSPNDANMVVSHIVERLESAKPKYSKSQNLLSMQKLVDAIDQTNCNCLTPLKDMVSQLITNQEDDENQEDDTDNPF